jgi:very-short-patch-repair endonuclease
MSSPQPARVHPHPSFAVLRLPEATPEHRFSPTRRFRFDFAWLHQKVALEVEGGVWQYGRHNRASGFLKDLEKYNLAVLLGWRVIRCTPQQLESGQAAEWIATLVDEWRRACPK